MAAENETKVTELTNALAKTEPTPEPRTEFQAETANVRTQVAKFEHQLRVNRLILSALEINDYEIDEDGNPLDDQNT